MRNSQALPYIYRIFFYLLYLFLIFFLITVKIDSRICFSNLTIFVFYIQAVITLVILHVTLNKFAIFLKMYKFIIIINYSI